MLLVLYPSPSAELAQAAVVTHERSSSPLSEAATLRSQLAESRGQVNSLQEQLDRANHLISYSSRYGISADLAGKVYDAATGENVDPELAFRLVKLESDFNTRAQSPAGAIGLTQLMPATARFYQKGLRARQLFDADLNLHIGFRYLHSLVEQYHGQIDMALLVYNGGEVAAAAVQASGKSPSSDYTRVLMKGYKGPGIID
ncbi:MAG: transglycosylase SLT domain-containing protein [Gemmatimonadaceae bacterium]|nr:transglycosylase SLT domain-containing protein [Gemmatimonadaceae bacterium]